MKCDSYIKCRLYSINDDFSIKSGYSYKECVILSKKKYVDTIIVEENSDGLFEVLTGVVFDYSCINISDSYSKLLRRYILKEKKHHSSDPIHISLYFEELISTHSRRCNYSVVDQDDINDYRETIISKYGSIDDYKKYLMNLKEYANGIYEGAINEYKQQKKLKKVR